MRPNNFNINETPIAFEQYHRPNSLQLTIMDLYDKLDEAIELGDISEEERLSREIHELQIVNQGDQRYLNNFDLEGQDDDHAAIFGE